MKTIYLTLFFSLIIALQSFADEFEVRSFKKLPTDISAVRFEKLDANDEKCAIVKVLTDLSSLSFESNSGIVAVEEKTGEYWIYISPGERRLRFISVGFIPLDYNIPETIESGNVYQMILTRKGDSDSGFTTGIILLKSIPTGADVFIDDEYKGTTPFQQELISGYYNYKLRKNDLYYEGDFSISVDKTTSIEIPLKSSLGIKDEEISVSYKEVKPISGTINISTNPAANIIINNENKGNGSWSGILTKGLHTIEARKDKYYTESIKLNIEEGKSLSKKITLQP